MSTAQEKLPVVVLISGNGTNLQRFIDLAAADKLPITIKAVISNRADAYGLQRAQQANIATVVLPNKDFVSREDYDSALVKNIRQFKPALIILAGFMRILTPVFINAFPNCVLNIHPSLLPKHRGLHTHRRVLENQEAEHGASVHFVTLELDGGPVVIQERITVNPDDTVESLQQRIHAIEYEIYPAAVKLFAQGRLRMNDGQVYFDNSKLEKPLSLTVLAEKG
jgi:phosphoribosylglycinamide formyltransferase-1